MRVLKKLTMAATAFCLVASGLVSFPDSAHAAKITSAKQAMALAKKELKNANVMEVHRDYDDGVLVYEIEAFQNTKEYELTYRASDGKLLSYSWETLRVQKYSQKKTIKKSKCRQLALKEVPGAQVLSLVQKYDGGVWIYKLKLTTGSKRYTLKYHAKTGKLLEYEWKLTENVLPPQEDEGDTSSTYIGLAKAKKIALAEAPKATVVKAEFDMDDGIPVYEIEMIWGTMEYDIKIHAKTGKILEIEREDNGIDFD